MTTTARKRRICFPITSRAYYGRSQLLIRKLHQHPAVELELMLGGSILLDKYSRHIADDIREGGFAITASLFNVIEGGNHVAMAKTACLTALEATNSLYTSDPDLVVICGDRFEQLAIAMAAAYLNKTIAHIEGGDLTGSIDESVRHAITKLAHIHFVTNDDAKRRVLAMGEDPKYVFNTGSLDVERVACLGDNAADITTATTGSILRRRFARWPRWTCRSCGSGRIRTRAPVRCPKRCVISASTMNRRPRRCASSRTCRRISSSRC